MRYSYQNNRETAVHKLDEIPYLIGTQIARWLHLFRGISIQSPAASARISALKLRRRPEVPVLRYGAGLVRACSPSAVLIVPQAKAQKRIFRSRIDAFTDQMAQFNAAPGRRPPITIGCAIRHHCPRLRCNQRCRDCSCLAPALDPFKSPSRQTNC